MSGDEALPEIIVSRLDRASLADHPEYVLHINLLLQELDPTHTTVAKIDVNRLLENQNFILVVALSHGYVVGMASLVIVEALNKRLGFIENVVVSVFLQGKGIGKALLRALIDYGTAQKLNALDLTSRPERIAANEMYQKLGFEKRATNVYRLKLEGRSGV